MTNAAAVQDKYRFAFREAQQSTYEIVRRKIDLQHGVDSSMPVDASMPTLRLEVRRAAVNILPASLLLF